ncbi:MAG: hypothetical protein N4A33_01920 [Bacteriovoracaceae bacterium]|jgi:hypothetical protein|nr:hypothetical protein [Bacteriovoracaceae bacterium]
MKLMAITVVLIQLCFAQTIQSVKDAEEIETIEKTVMSLTDNEKVHSQKLDKSSLRKIKRKIRKIRKMTKDKQLEFFHKNFKKKSIKLKRISQKIGRNKRINDLVFKRTGANLKRELLIASSTEKMNDIKEKILLKIEHYGSYYQYLKAQIDKIEFSRSKRSRTIASIDWDDILFMTLFVLYFVSVFSIIIAFILMLIGTIASGAALTVLIPSIVVFIPGTAAALAMGATGGMI